MSRVWTLMLGLLLVTPAWSDDMSEVVRRGAQVLREAEKSAMARCDTRQIAVHKPAWDYFNKVERVEETTVTIDWSGGCEQGLREGDGVLTWVETSSEENRPSSGKPFTTTIISTEKSQGRFIKGQRLGLWCSERKSYVKSGESAPSESVFSYCQLLAGHGDSLTATFRKQEDGSWQQLIGNKFTDMTLAPGTLEAASAKLLAQAAAGNGAAESVTLMVHNPMLDDLLKGGRVEWAREKGLIDLHGKRVGVVLSSATLAEMDRIGREREGLIAAGAVWNDNRAEWLTRFALASNPARLLVNITKVLRSRGAEVQSADDLSGLKQGKLDYVLVVDWKTQAQIELLTRSLVGVSSPPETVMAPTFGYLLIEPGMKVIKSFSTDSVCHAPWTTDKAPQVRALALLGGCFESILGKDYDDPGSAAKTLTYNFKE